MRVLQELVGRNVHQDERELLLHEHAHVEQWRTVPWFAVRYVWESLRRGYFNNRFEVAARQAAGDRLRTAILSR